MYQFNKVSLRLVNEKTYEYNPTTIRNSIDVVKFIDDMEDIRNHTEERVYCIAMNAKNNIVSFSQIAQGGMNTCNIDIKELFKTILLCNASKFILIHNHPSGDSTPSKNDYQTTEKVKEASKIMNIEFLDHIVVAQNGYTSCYNIKGGE